MNDLNQDIEAQSVGRVVVQNVSINQQWMIATDFASATTLAVKSTAGVLAGFYAINRNSAVRYLQFYNLNNGTSGAPLMSFAVGPIVSSTPGSLIIGTNVFGDSGVNFATAITMAWSTTETSYNAATAADHSAIVFYL